MPSFMLKCSGRTRCATEAWYTRNADTVSNIHVAGRIPVITKTKENFVIHTAK